MPRLPLLTTKSIVDVYEKYKTQGRSRSSVATSNWPTALSHPCTAYGFYNRTVPANHRRKIATRLAMIFSEGNDQARMVKRDLQDAGFEVQDQESQMTSKEYQISGRQDMTLWKQGFREKVHCEIKSCAPFTFDSIRSVKDLMNPDREWLHRWYKQVCLYMFVQGLKRYLLVLKNKSLGSIKVVEIQADQFSFAAVEPMLKKAKKINRLIQIGGEVSPKDKIADPQYCDECPFYTTCLPTLTFGPGAAVLTDEDAAEMEIRLNRRKKLAPLVKEYNELDEDLKEEIKGMYNTSEADRIVAGNWIALVKESKRGAYEVKAQNIISVKFMESKEEKA